MLYTHEKQLSLEKPKSSERQRQNGIRGGILNQLQFQKINGFPAVQKDWAHTWREKDANNIQYNTCNNKRHTDS